MADRRPTFDELRSALTSMVYQFAYEGVKDGERYRRTCGPHMERK